MKYDTIAGGEMDRRLTYIDRWLSLEIEEGRLIGATIQVHHQGNLIYTRATGSRDLVGRGDMSLDTRFWIASMTKPLTSLAALILAEEGRLLLSDPIETYLPEFKDIPVMKEGSVEQVTVARRPPTVQDLMRHTSGLTYGEFGEGPLHRAYKETNVYDFENTNESMSKRLASLPLFHQPGTYFEYGMSTDVLGRLIEVVSGSSLAEFMKARILDPLRMTATGFDGTGDGLPPIAGFSTAMQNLKLVPPSNKTPTWQSGGGGLWSTVEDYMCFAKLLLGNGRLEDTRLISPSMARHMMSNHLAADIKFGSYTPELGITAPGPANGQGFGLGLAVRCQTGQNPAPGSIGEAFWPGVSGTNFWIDRQEQLAVVFMAHAAEGRTRHRTALRQLVYQALPVLREIKL